jgi:LPXTG-motif cell wall-anchored protein
VTTTVAGGPLPFTGASSLPMLFGALALLVVGGASLLAGSRRRRRA